MKTATSNSKMNGRKFHEDLGTPVKAHRVTSTVSSLGYGSRASKSSSAHSMLPSARERIDNKHNFFKNYFLLCNLNNTVPRLKDRNAGKHLEFFSDRIRSEDWAPIIKAIACDQSLNSVRILNYNLMKPGVTRQPAIDKVKLLTELITALSKLISVNKVLESLELQCLRLDTKHVILLAEALKTNKTISKLGLSHCNIGNEGCEILCNTLRYQPTITEIDLSGCDITENGAVYIAQTITVQTIFRHAECWKHSLRYRQPNVSVIDGLRSINLDGNIQLQDSGFMIIMNAIMDDMWMKDISCKNCGLTNLAAQKAVEVAQKSRLSSLDIRRNLEVDPEYLRMIENTLTPKHCNKPFASSPELCSDDIHMLANDFTHLNTNNSSCYNCCSYQNNWPFLSTHLQTKMPVYVPRLRLPKSKSSMSGQNVQHKFEIAEMLAKNFCPNIDENRRSQKQQFVMVEKELFERMLYSFKNLVNSFNEAKQAGFDFMIDNSDSSENGNYQPHSEHCSTDKAVSGIISDTNAVYDGLPTEDNKLTSLSDYEADNVSICHKTRAQNLCMKLLENSSKD